MTVITPVPVWLTWSLYFVHWWLRNISRIKNLRQLRFIHFARWTILKRRHFNIDHGDQSTENLRYDYLLFSTNFNGQWDQYIDAFSLIEKTGVNALWWATKRFPGAWPVRPFKLHIRYNEYPTSYYYNAYPGASVRDIEAALDLNLELERFRIVTRDMDADTFYAEYQAFLNRIQNQLASAKHPASWPIYPDMQPDLQVF